ncbi:MAG: hypothetical protein NUW37_09485 [Planctomycetes bacterium]|nr:hypothetical protein [Planctomycetota bacterium]
MRHRLSAFSIIFLISCSTVDEIETRFDTDVQDGQRTHLGTYRQELAYFYDGEAELPGVAPTDFEPETSVTVSAAHGGPASLTFEIDMSGESPRLIVTDGEGRREEIKGQTHGIPYEMVTSVSASLDETSADYDIRHRYVYFGSGQGVVRYDLNSGGWRYYWGRRWLQSNEVISVKAASDGSCWVKTSEGFTHLTYVECTLEEKALAFTERAQHRHDRMGLVASSSILEPGNYESNKMHDNDNDGLWTAMYAAGECFRYAVTKDPVALELCRKHFRALVKLSDVTGIPGFTARSYDNLLENGGVHPHGEWHVSDVYPGEQWKGDTSSDEIDGHYFFFPIYYELVADDEERETCRIILKEMTDYIIDGGFYLRDVDGKPTTWGRWAPETINIERPWRKLFEDYYYMSTYENGHDWWMERGLNALEILGYLRAAYNIVGDERYKDAIDYLVDEHGYHKNALYQKIVFPPNEQNHSDDELAYLAYYCALSQEPADSRVFPYFRESIRRSHKTVGAEHNPLYDFMFKSVGGFPFFGALEAIEQLRRTPVDVRSWTVNNSQRSDLTYPEWQNRSGSKISAKPFATDERSALKYNSDPYSLDGGSDGRSEEDGGFFVLAYWYGRYHGIISERNAIDPDTVGTLCEYISVPAPGGE